jgi:hypothetical protein
MAELRGGGRIVTYRERREAKAERLREWATKREQKAVDQLNSYPTVRHDIAFNTQPGHIPFRARIIKADERAYESLEKAGDMASRARNIEAAADRAIYSDDDNAIEALKERIASLEAERERVKVINKAIRQGPGWEARIVPALTKQEKAELLRYAKFSPGYRDGDGIPAYHLRNLSGNLSHQRKRLAELEYRAIHGQPWRHIWLKWGGKCSACGKDIPKGEGAWWRKPEMRCRECDVPKAEAPAVVPDPAAAPLQ